MKHNQVIEAIQRNRPGVSFSYSTNDPNADVVDLNGLDWPVGTEPPTWNEVAEWVSDIEFADADAAALETIRVLLQESDIWVIRAYEDGVPVSEDRKQYRSALRTAAASEVPSSIVLPDVPVFGV